MKVSEHVKELKRNAMIVAMVGIIIFFIAFIFSNKIMKNLVTYYQIDLYAFNILESLNAQIQFSLIITMLLVIPLIFFQIYNYCKPILEDFKARKYIALSIFLTITGFMLGYTIFTKLIIKELTSESIFILQISVSSILNLAMIIGFGLAFCLNLMIIIPFLTNLKIITIGSINKYIPHAIVVCLLVAGFITPGADIVSQIILTIPMLCSIGVGILLSKLNKGGKTC